MRNQPDEPRRRRLTELFQRYGDDIHAYASHRLGPDQAADVVSEVFLAAWRRLDTIRPGNERPWLYGAARLVILAGRRGNAEWAALRERAGTAAVDEPPDLAEDVVTRWQVRSVLASLAEADREVLLTAVWYDLSPAQAASVLGCSRATYAVRLHRARRRFGQAFRETGL
ncbi:MAG: hypothetical protein AUI14_03820, partial [Actinobacteria bacterium 13_2_20CM_2_71_6]